MYECARARSLNPVALGPGVSKTRLPPPVTPPSRPGCNGNMLLMLKSQDNTYPDTNIPGTNFRRRFSLRLGGLTKRIWKLSEQRNRGIFF